MKLRSRDTQKAKKEERSKPTTPGKEKVRLKRYKVLRILVAHSGCLATVQEEDKPRAAIKKRKAAHDATAQPRKSKKQAVSQGKSEAADQQLLLIQGSSGGSRHL